MKNNFIIFFTAILPLFLFNACSDDEDKIISTLSFTLNDPYRWNLSRQTETFHVINDKVEMLKYIKSPDEKGEDVNIPDFNKSTLLLASGTTQSGVAKIETKLIKHNDADYTLEIYVFINAASSTVGYIVAVTVPRLANNVQIVKN